MSNLEKNNTAFRVQIAETSQGLKMLFGFNL